MKKFASIVLVVLFACFVAVGSTFAQDDAADAGASKNKMSEVNLAHTLEMLKTRLEERDEQINNLTLIVVAITGIFGFMVLAVLYYRYRTLEVINGKLEELSLIDSLTGLANRKSILGDLKTEEVRFDRTKRPFSVIIADIDHFSVINDTYGQSCGDSVIIKIGDLLVARLRRQDSVSRWGGEEYLILLPETDGDGAKIIADELLKAVNDRQMYCGGKSFAVTISLGISTFDGSCSLEGCIVRADQALHRAKENGRNTVEQSPGVFSS